jgi:hypothetical protein
MDARGQHPGDIAIIGYAVWRSVTSKLSARSNKRCQQPTEPYRRWHEPLPKSVRVQIPGLRRVASNHRDMPPFFIRNAQWQRNTNERQNNAMAQLPAYALLNADAAFDQWRNVEEPDGYARKALPE